MDKGIEPVGLLTLKAAAYRLGVTTRTLRRWSNAGLLPVVLMPSGQRRYRRQDIEAIATPRVEDAS